MQFVLAAALLATVGASSLRAKPVDDQAKVQALRGELEHMSAGLVKMLAPGGTLAKMKIAAPMQAFEKELEKTLAETKTEKDTKKVLQRLESAQAGVHGLVKDISASQVSLMKESEDQQDSLLMGVLMTRQKEPMDKQLEILKDNDFKSLPVVKALLAKKDTKTPLFQQVGAWLDAHSSKPAAPAAPAVPAVKVGKDGKPDVSGLVSALQTRLHHLEESEEQEKKLHEAAVKELEVAEKKEEKKSKKLAHHIQLMKKAEIRKYAKQSALSHHDVESMKAAIAAIQKGDLKALMKAQTALNASLKAMESQSGGFLYLIQLGHRVQNLDCPYCAAQCVEKCHNEGKPYTSCLVSCADAGKR